MKASAQEFATALSGETGIETRNHNGIPVLYVAVPVSGGAVRLAYPLADVEIARPRRGGFCYGCFGRRCSAALAISALAAETITRRRS